MLAGDQSLVEADSLSMGIRQRPSSLPAITQNYHEAADDDAVHRDPRLGQHDKKLTKTKLRSFPWSGGRPTRSRLALYSGLSLLVFALSTMNLLVLQQHKIMSLEPTRMTNVADGFHQVHSVFPRVFQMPEYIARSPHHLFVTPLLNRSSSFLKAIQMDSQHEITNIDNNKLSSAFLQPPVTDNSDGECVPVADWQTSSFPTCNNLHDIDMRQALVSDWMKPYRNVTTAGDHSAKPKVSIEWEDSPELVLLAQGWFRSTWELHNRQADSSVNTEPRRTDDVDRVVLKTLRLEREFLSEYYDLHNRDAVAMERLTFSSYVVDIYGYCGQSALNEYADFPHGKDVKSLEKLNRRLRGHRDMRSMLLRLMQAYGLVTGLAHVHQAGAQWSVKSELKGLVPPSSALMVHYDINPRNIALFKGGKPKINDFNIAEFRQFNPRTKDMCGFPSRMHAPWWRSPEEVKHHDNETVWLDEKVDIYALGSVFIHLFTSYSPRGKMSRDREESVSKQVEAGEPPVLLAPFQKENGTIAEVFRDVIAQCHEKAPLRRPTARQISSQILRTLNQERPKLVSLKDGTDQAAIDASSPNDSENENNDSDEDDMVEEKG